MFENMNLTEIKSFILNHPEDFYEKTTNIKSNNINVKAKLFDYMSILEVLEKKEDFNEEFFIFLYKFYSEKNNFDMDSLAPDKDLSLFLVKNNFLYSLKKLKEEFPETIKYNCIFYACYALDSETFNKFKNIFPENIIHYNNCVKSIVKTGELMNSLKICYNYDDYEKMNRLMSFYDNPEILSSVIKEVNNINDEFKKICSYFNIRSLEECRCFSIEDENGTLEKTTLFYYLCNKNKARLMIDLLNAGYDFIKDSKINTFDGFKKEINKMLYKSKQKKEINILYSIANISYEKKELNEKIILTDEKNINFKKRI